ncbi:MAG TPA: hypothetical protein VFE51_22225 [Verrucomicrobiae bacterium]|nr:hypothetical protein [Verrucomicrobiae bacterium]
MRMRLAVSLAFGFAAFTGLTAEPNGHAPPLINFEVVWAAPTNSWPDKLWAYKVVPQDFAEPVISNLMRIGAFTMKDRTKAPAVFAEKDDKTLFFGELEGNKKHLAICPSLGWVDYFNHAAESSGNSAVVGVPDQKRATQLGLQYLRLVGIDVSQIATKSETSQLDLHWGSQTSSWMDEKTKKQVTVTNRLTVFFRRRIDGLNVGGIGLNGGFVVGFGNREQIVELQIYWRNIMPYRLHDCATPAEISDWLRTGRISLPPQAGPSDLIRKLTITYAVPFYATRFGEEPENFVSPKVDIIAIVENSKGQAPVQFQAAILRPGG